jgi:hypothetical protein
MKKLTALALVLALLLIPNNARGQYYDPVTHLEIHWSSSEDAELGRAVSREFEAEHRIDRTSSNARRWQAVCNKLRSGTMYSDILAWSFSVIADMEETNAFAFPGGPIYITPTLLEKLTTDDELAFVAAHEISHCTEHHYWNKVQERQQYNQILKNAGVTTNPYLKGNKTVETLVNIGREVFGLEYSRKEEEEADRKAVALMARAGYHPGAAVTALEKLGGKKRSWVGNWLSSHPDTPARIKKVSDILVRDFPDLKAYDPAKVEHVKPVVTPGGYVTKIAEFVPAGSAFQSFAIRGEVQNPKERMTESIWYKIRVALIALKTNPSAPDGFERIELCSAPFDSKTGKYTLTIPPGVPKELADQGIVKCILFTYLDHDEDGHLFGAADRKTGVPLHEFLLLRINPTGSIAEAIPSPLPFEKEVAQFLSEIREQSRPAIIKGGKPWEERRFAEHEALMDYPLKSLQPGWYRVAFAKGKPVVTQDFTRDFPSFVGNVKN